MFLTEQDYKVLPYFIPDLNGDKDLDTFLAFVPDQEKNALESLLGPSLYDSFVDGLAALPNVYSPTATYNTDERVLYGIQIWKCLLDGTSGTPPSESISWTLVEKNKWAALRDGDTYRINDLPYKWKGVKDLLKPFIFSQWVREVTESLTGSGVVADKSENSDNVSSGTKICAGYNDYSTKAGNYCNLRNTLYGYLYSTINDSVFDDSFDEAFHTFKNYLQMNFQYPEKINVFDL